MRPRPLRLRGPMDRGMVSSVDVIDDAEFERDIAGHLERNVVLVARLQELGVDIELPRSVDLHFWAEDKDSAEELARALEAEGFAISAFGPRMLGPKRQHPREFNVEATRVLSPTQVVAPDFVRMIATLARQRLSVFDGWGTSV